MTTIHYREITCNVNTDSEVIDEHTLFDLNRFAQVCGQNPEWILQLIEYDILTQPQSKTHYQFAGQDVLRARRAYRLQRDFDASLSAVAVMLDLIDEVQQLRRQVKHINI